MADVRDLVVGIAGYMAVGSPHSTFPLIMANGPQGKGGKGQADCAGGQSEVPGIGLSSG